MDATLVAGWEALCQALSSAFTRPTSVTFLHIATGWVLCRSKPTVTNLVCTIGTSLLGHAAKHWTVYERFFYRAVWSLEYVCWLLLAHVVAPLVKTHATEAVIDLAIDDTTCGRCGKQVAYAGYFKDASAGNTLKTVVHWAHNWVIGCVSLRPKRWPNWVMGLPVLFALYRKRPDCDRRHAFLTRQQIAAGMIQGWRTIEVRIYGQRVQRRVLPIVCLWYHVSKDHPIKFVVIRDPTGQQKDDFVFCTDPTVDEKEIIERFAARWPIEECIHEGKQLGGFEQVQGWCPRTVERQAPMALMVQTLVKAWYVNHGVRAASAQPRGVDWMPSKDHPSYLDMLATLRRVLWDHRINHNSTLRSGLGSLWKTLQFTLCAAA